MGSTADWAPLGDPEFDSLRAIYDWCEQGRDVASESGLIVVQAGYDLHQRLLTIPTMERNPNRKARQVTRHVARMADHLQGIQLSFAKLPKVILQVYGEEITRARQKNTKPLDLRNS